MIPDDAWPAGDRLRWDDDETLTHYDFTTEPYTLTPYSDEESAAVKARVAESAAATAAHETVAELRAALAELLGREDSAERTTALVETLARLALEGVMA